MKIVIVYENVPESTDTYLLDVSDADFAWMKKCHGYYVNFDMPPDAEAACNRLSEYLVDKVKYTGKGPIALKAADGLAHYDALILTGFVL